MKHKKSCPKRCIFGCLGCLGSRNIMRCLSCLFPKTELWAKKQKKKVIYLTIDDFPSRNPANSRRLLDILDKHQVKVTFFVIKYNVDIHKDNASVMRSALARGHELGNHMAKDKAYTSCSKEEFERILLEVEDAIEGFQPGFKNGFPKLFRAPHAKIDKKMASVLVRHNYLSVLCDTYSFDPEYDADPEFHSNLLVSNVKPGSIVILHTPEDWMRAKTFDILEDIIPRIKKKGFEFQILSEYFKSPEFVEKWNKKNKKINESLI